MVIKKFYMYLINVDWLNEFDNLNFVDDTNKFYDILNNIIEYIVSKLRNKNIDYYSWFSRMN